MPGERKPDQPAGKRPQPGGSHHPTIVYFLAALLGVLILQWVWISSSQVEELPYSRFETLVGQGRVSEVTVGQTTIQGKLKTALPNGKTSFTTVRVEPQLADWLAAKGAVVNGQPSSGWLVTLISWFAPLLFFYALWAFLLRPAAGAGLGGLLAAGRSRARVFAETDIKTTFADVAGVDEAKFELQEVVSFLKDPKSYGRLGAHVPKGVLLVGPPGTGKTLLARAVAGEAGVPFFYISGSEFVEMFVGVGAARVRDLFETAQKSAPAIIFIDELDSLGRSRSGLVAGGLDEKEQTLNQLLAELDGFDPSTGVILLAATNRPEILDPALLRAGRFDRQVLVDRPDINGRKAILAVHVRKIALDKGVDLATVAGLTTGFTGADLANLVNEAALVATRRGGEAVTLADFTAAIERIVAGLEKKSRVLRPEERRRVAYHEMGHALVAASLPGVDPVQKVSIVPRGVGALGYTMQRPTEDRFLLARSDLENRIAVLLGGRMAESLIFDGDVSTGAADDLQRATEIALEMVTRHGMDATVGLRVFQPVSSPFLTLPVDRPAVEAEASAREIDLAVRELMAKCADQAKAILEGRRADLEAGVVLLMKNENLTAEEFPALKPVRRAAPPRADSPRRVTAGHSAPQEA